MFRHRAALRVSQTRSLSLVDNIKKLLKVSAPLAPSQQEQQTPDASQHADATAAADTTKVGTANRNKTRVIGFDINAPERLSGAAFDAGLQTAYEQVLGSPQARIPEDKRLGLAQAILQHTGYRVPDHLLNKAEQPQEVTAFFMKEAQKGKGRLNALQVDPETLPSNVRIN